MAELTGRTKMAMATLTSPGIVTPHEASTPSKLTENQHRKSAVDQHRKSRQLCPSFHVMVDMVAIISQLQSANIDFNEGVKLLGNGDHKSVLFVFLVLCLLAL